MIEKEFNLLHEPWILLMKPDGEVGEVSLLCALEHAHEWKALAGELPTQDVAILRLMLAVLHTVMARYNPSGKEEPLVNPYSALERWKEVWDKGRLPFEAIERYLLRHEGRFWLFHPTHPFYQVTDLKGATEYPAAKLIGEISESNNKTRLFQSRFGAPKERLSYSEATRWLLHLNAYDDSSVKPQPGPYRRAKKLPSPGVSWLGKLGLVTAGGDNLFETLLLNLVLLPNGEDEMWGRQKPIWETEPNVEERIEIPLPDNATELLTLQSRRFVLTSEGGAVTGFRSLSGDFFGEQNAFGEQMTLWRNTTRRSSDPPVFSPKTHDPDRAVWRDFSALAVQAHGARVPGVVAWLSRLSQDDVIAPTFVSFSTYGVRYGASNGSIADVFDDRITFHASLLTRLGTHWVSRIVDELRITDLLVQQIGFLARDLAKAGGDASGSGRRQKAREVAYFSLDLPFRQWLSSINPEVDIIDDTMDAWWMEARRIALAIGRDLVAGSGINALTGRMITENKIERWYAAPDLFNRFLARISSRAALERK